MMRVGVISDTHGVSFGIMRALRAIPDAEAWIHLGDFAADAHILEREAGVPVHSVRGNCDLDTRVPAELVLTLGGARVLLCHGHQYAVRYDRTRLFYRAEELGCAAALYGHTHLYRTEIVDDVFVMNPGSLDSPRNHNEPTYGVLIISSAGEIQMNIVSVKK